MTAIVLFLVVIGQISINTAAKFLAAFMYPFFLLFILLVVLLTEIPDQKIRYYILGFLQCLIAASIGFSFKVSLLAGQYTPITMPYVFILFLIEFAVYYAVFWWEAKYEKIEPKSGTESMLGDTATILNWNKDSGRISHEGTSWQAQSKTTYYFENGDEVIITDVTGLLVTIKKQ